MQIFKVTSENSGKRADIFVSENYPQFSRSTLKGLFENSNVFINKDRAKAGYRLNKGDVLTIDEAPLYYQPASINLPIIYEDEDVIVINKPAGVLTHSKGGLNEEATVASFIKPMLDNTVPDNNRAGIVHRLDRATSGIIITAKNEKTLHYLQKQFSQRKVRKTYIAVIEGDIDPKDAVIDAPILRNPKKPQTFIVAAGGKPAITEYHTQKIFYKAKKEYSLLELMPQTGRTHQLRVHLAYLKHPITGDSVYGNGDGNLMLHAKELELTLPGGVRKIFSVPLPDKFRDFIDE